MPRSTMQYSVSIADSVINNKSRLLTPMQCGWVPLSRYQALFCAELVAILLANASSSQGFTPASNLLATSWARRRLAHRAVMFANCSGHSWFSTQQQQEAVDMDVCEPDSPQKPQQPAPAWGNAWQQQQQSLFNTAPQPTFLQQSRYLNINTNYPGLQQVNATPPMYVVHDFLSAAECEYLIREGDCFMYKSPVVGEGQGIITASRTSSR
jgi:hypothetical protein